MTETGLFCEYLRSVALLSYDSCGRSNVLLPTNQFIDWLKRYDSWFKQTIIGIGRLSYLYNRTLSLLARDLESETDQLMAIAEAAKRLGFAVLLQLSIVDAAKHHKAVTSLQSARSISTWFIDGRRVMELSNIKDVLPLLQGLVADRSSLILFGEFDHWRKTGLLNMENLNGINFSLIPPPRRQPQNVNFGHRDESLFSTVSSSARLRLLPTDSQVLVNSYMYDPCSSRLQLIVTADGHIYPCQGSVGIESLCLGYIHGDVAQLHQTVDLSRLILKGPELPYVTDLTEDEVGLPAACVTHRRKLLKLC
jgi:hypothetical protein